MLTRFLRSKFHRPLQHNLPVFTFCTLPAIDFADYTRLYRRQITPEEFEFTLNSGTDKITFELPGTVTIGDLKQKVREFSQDIKDIKALSLDLAEYSDLIKISDLGKEAHYLILNNENLIKVRSLELTEVDKAEMEYEKKEEACMDCGLPFIEQQIIINYLKRVDVLNKATLGKKLFADSDLYEGKINKNIIIQNLLDGIVMDKNHLVTNEKELLDYYYQLRAKASDLEAQKELLEKKAYRITKLKMSLGLTVLFSQLAFVGIGTYSVYSWDIMEPISYFIGLLGSIILSGMYFRLYRDYSHHGIMKHLSEKELDKILKKQKEFSLEELQRLKDEIELVEKRIKTNILIDL